MEYIFYFIQLFSPNHYNELNTEPPLTIYESSYAQQVFRKNEIHCLSRIIYNESRGESFKGKKLVAQTTINRIKSGDFQDSICEALKARNAYSFYNPKSKKSIDKIRKYPVEYTKIAEEALDGKYEKLISKKVTYFKVCSHYSGFFQTLVMVKRVNNHCFYKANDIQLARR